MSRLVFIRHAQASFGADDYDNLSDFGIEQSKTLGRYFEKEQMSFDKVFIGPLKRHQQTFDHCLSQMKNSVIKGQPTYLDGLKEHNGHHALKIMYDQLDDLVPEVKRYKKEIMDNPSLKRLNSLKIMRKFMPEWMDEKIILDHPEVLKYDLWKKEVHEALNQICEEAKKYKDIAIFTSGGTIGCTIAKAMGIDNGRTIANLNDSIRNTSMSYFHSSSLGFNVLSFNEIPHLTKAQITFV